MQQQDLALELFNIKAIAICLKRYLKAKILKGLKEAGLPKGHGLWIGFDIVHKLMYNHDR